MLFRARDDDPHTVTLDIPSGLIDIARELLLIPFYPVAAWRLAGRIDQGGWPQEPTVR